VNNINQAHIRGLEAALTTEINHWDLNINLTLLDPRDRSHGTNHNNLLPRRARQTLHLQLDRQFGKKYSLGATLHAEGRRYDDLANSRRLSGYATVDLRGEYTITKDWRLQARLANLFDKDYETAAFYNQPGRGLFLTLRYQPQ
jgi:vitamin B12 transporter